jgi:hypothetical protein
VGQQLGRIDSTGAAKDAIPAVLVVCKRCGYLMPLAADIVSGNGKAA